MNRPSDELPAHPGPGLTRRHLLQSLGGLAAWTAASSLAAEPNLRWRTAVGLNGFESGTAKYKQTYPIWEVAKVGVANIGYLHLTDTDGTLRDGGTSKHLACGEGHANLPESLRLLREGGFRGWAMIDAWEIPDPYDACAKGKAMLDRAAT